MAKKPVKKEVKVKEQEKNELIVKLHEIGQTIATIRNRPLLIMFYSRERGGGIGDEDVYYLENVLEKRLSGDKKDLDVIIQTLGGSADSSYLLAQLLRDFCKRMEIFVPHYAFSGGTLISLSSELIHLGRTARLSPIDLQLGNDDNSQFSLLNIDKYIEFVEDSCKEFNFKSEKNKTEYIIPLMEKLVEEISPTDLGALFRLKDLTKYHAQILLMTYMLKNEPDKKNIADHIIRRLTSGSPNHEFQIDLHIAEGIGLRITEMEDNLYKLSKILVNICSLLKRQGEICKFHSDERRSPFFEVFLPRDNKSLKDIEDLDENEPNNDEQ